MIEAATRLSLALTVPLPVTLVEAAALIEGVPVPGVVLRQ